jgi:hypothetical protein
MRTNSSIGQKSYTGIGLINNILDFFFRATSAHTLVPIRVATGFMIAYVHCVWFLQLEDFLGPNALVNNELWLRLHGGDAELAIPADSKWTYLAWTESLSLIRIHEACGIVFGVLAGLGLFTRLSMAAAWFLTLMTVHRMTGFLFGLDQIVIMLSFYLCISKSNEIGSLDRFLCVRFPKLSQSMAMRVLTGLNGSQSNEISNSWQNCLSMRLMQIHLCVIYFFGGLGKLRGEMWWDGSALWFAAASYEYQSNDLTWIGRYPAFVALLTHVTLFWEVLYTAIVWPRWTRPAALLLAFAVHLGIALFMGMITFGFMMIIANISFVPSDFTRRTCQAVRRWIGLKS